MIACAVAGHAAELDPAVAQPTDGEQPCFRAGEWTRAWFARADAAPAGEPAAGRTRVRRAAPECDAVLGRVVQNLGERVPHFARSAQDPGVVAIREESAVPLPESVESFRDADRERLDAARKLDAIAGFAHEVHVVALHRVVHEAEVLALAHRRERVYDDRVRAAAAQRRQPSGDFQRDVNREPRRQRFASAMRDSRLLSLRLRPRAGAPTAPSARKIERLLVVLLARCAHVSKTSEICAVAPNRATNTST